MQNCRIINTKIYNREKSKKNVWTQTGHKSLSDKPLRLNTVFQLGCQKEIFHIFLWIKLTLSMKWILEWDSMLRWNDCDLPYTDSWTVSKYFTLVQEISPPVSHHIIILSVLPKWFHFPWELLYCKCHHMTSSFTKSTYWRSGFTTL